jgi:hypothetical protein
MTLPRLWSTLETRISPRECRPVSQPMAESRVSVVHVWVDEGALLVLYPGVSRDGG